MNEDKSFLLQKQVRDNSEALQKELLDLKNWEQEMKRKEKELLNSGEQIKVLPPIRNKKKKIIESSPVASTSKASAPDRIQSFDYHAWDKFDVDAACRTLDDEESDDETEDEKKKVLENAQKSHSEAVKLKEQGNSFVKKKLYDSAIKSYSEAIKLFSYDEVFYANRALCYLKQKNWCSAENDCTAALQLDENYVKAYHRRATARIELKDYEGAKRDINRVLNLEPSNKEAEAMLSKVTKKVERTKQPLLITEISSEDSSVEKKIGQKMCHTPKLQEQIKIPNQQEQVQKLNHQTKTTKKKIEEICSESEQALLEDKLPDWFPKLDENYSIVKPVELSPHQRSKKSMKRVQVKNVDFGDNILPKTKVDDILPNNTSDKILPNTDADEILLKVDADKILPNTDDNNILPNTNVENDVKKSKQQKFVKKQKNIVEKEEIIESNKPKILEEVIENKNKETTKETPKIREIIKKKPIEIEDLKEEISQESADKSKTRPLIEVISSSEEVPAAPKTSVQFFMEWKRNKSLEFRYLYLKQIPPNSMPTLFKESLESNVLEDIVTVLKEKFLPKEKIIFQYLEQLCNVQRFRTLIMFVERKTKEALKELFEHCRRVEERSEQELNVLFQKYEL